MANKQSASPKAFPGLVRSSRLSTLWALRMLVHRGADEDVFKGQAFALTRARLKLPVLEKWADSSESWQRLEASLKVLEAKSSMLRLPDALRWNLDMLQSSFEFDDVECLLLALAALMRADEVLHQVASRTQNTVNAPETLSRVLGIRVSRISRALEPDSRIRRSNLIEASSGGDVSEILSLRRGGLRKIGLRKLDSVEKLFRSMLVSASGPTLTPKDYAHLEPDFQTLRGFVSDAVDNQRRGVNVLLYGAPGTGKTELVRLLAKQVSAPLFDVADVDEDGDALSPQERLAGAATGLFLLGKRRALVCFDEVEAIFNDGSGLFGKPSTAESQKLAFNRLLEQNEVPVFWVANEVHGMDPAFVRRFDLCIHLESPPRSQRLKLLEQECGQIVSQSQLRRLAEVKQITPAMVTRASSVVRRMAPPDQASSERLFEQVLDGVLKVQHQPSLKCALRGIDSTRFDPALCNSGVDLDQLVVGLSKSGTGRICLFGPPGTGKTAFGHWMAERLDKPLVLKRASDLQSPFLGVMEKKLAEAFESAQQDGAILQIDEVDSFLQDRRQVQRSWETSQVNEFLTQLESYEGLFIASTNLMDNLDQAALRRFDYKIRMDFLRPEQTIGLLERQLVQWGWPPTTMSPGIREKLMSQSLVPGDFAVVARRHAVVQFEDMDAVIDALCAEAAFRVPASRRMGFV